MMHAAHAFVAVLISATVVAWSATRLARQRFDPREDLPLDLCNLSALIAPVQLLAPAPLVAAWAVCVGAPGGIVSILSPDLEPCHDRATHVKFWIVHYGLIADGLLVALLFPPSGGTALLLGLPACIAALVPLSALANHRLGANYLFLRNKPPTPSPLDWFGPWPRYLAISILLAAVAIIGSFAAWSAWWGR